MKSRLVIMKCAGSCFCDDYIYALFMLYLPFVTKVGDDTRESIKISENQAIEACKRMEQMNNELIKSQVQYLLQYQYIITRDYKSLNTVTGHFKGL